MKKIALILILITLPALFGCTDKNSAEWAKPDNLYKANNSIDMLIYQNTAYVNASDNEWIVNLSLTAGPLIGTILRTDVKKRFADFDATILAAGTEIFSVIERNDIFLADIGGDLIPYYICAEG